VWIVHGALKTPLLVIVAQLKPILNDSLKMPEAASSRISHDCAQTLDIGRPCQIPWLAGHPRLRLNQDDDSTNATTKGFGATLDVHLPLPPHPFLQEGQHTQGFMLDSVLHFEQLEMYTRQFLLTNVILDFASFDLDIPAMEIQNLHSRAVDCDSETWLRSRRNSDLPKPSYCLFSFNLMEIPRLHTSSAHIKMSAIIFGSAPFDPL
jgi:hypothetical protein